MNKNKINGFVKNALLAGIFLVGSVFIYRIKVARASLSINKDSQADFQAGKYEQRDIDVGSTLGEIKLQRDTGSWDVGESDPADMNLYTYTETSMIKVGRFIYMLRNRGIGQLMRYDLDSREWKEMALIPNGMYEVADMTSNGSDTLYVFATRYSAGPPSLASYKHFFKI